MNRRRFVQLFAGGIIGTAAVLHLPGKLVAKTRVGRESACVLLRRAWFDHYQKTGWPPERLIVGRDLYEAFGDELVANERFISRLGDRDAYNGWIPEHMLFKGGRVEPRGAGWTIRTVA